jgi:TolA-binding protein
MGDISVHGKEVGPLFDRVEQLERQVRKVAQDDAPDDARMNGLEERLRSLEERVSAFPPLSQLQKAFSDFNTRLKALEEKPPAPQPSQETTTVETREPAGEEIKDATVQVSAVPGQEMAHPSEQEPSPQPAADSSGRTNTEGSRPETDDAPSGTRSGDASPVNKPPVNKPQK